jgi:DNA (cytosine-5)-methyltransferase 1
MENVEGILLGEAITYVQRIYKQFKDIGYSVKHYLLKGEYMGVPQKRHRVFFICLRNDIQFDFEMLDMYFNYEHIYYNTIKEGNKEITPKMKDLFGYVQKGEKDFVKAWNRKNNPGNCEKRMLFNEIITYGDDVMQTIRATGMMYEYDNKSGISDRTIANATTFPRDYDFNREKPTYICGMSVPPIMIKRIVTRLIESGIFDYKIKEN